MEQFNIKSDKTNNRLYVILKGYFLESEIELARNILLRELKELRFGLDLIIDISDMITNPAYLSDMFYHRMIHIVKDESRYITRIIKKYRRFESLKKYMKLNSEVSVRIKNFTSVQEAEDFLNHNQLTNIIYCN